MNILAVNDELIRLSRGRIKRDKIINKNMFEAFPFLKERLIDKEYEYVIRTGEIFLSEEKTDSFLSNVSHELRTPLTSVLGYTELLLEEDINEEQRHKLEIILRNSKRLTRLIKSLLDTTLIESRNIQLDLQMVSINELVAHVAEDMKTIALVKNLPIYIEIPQLPLIQGDRDRLMQVFNRFYQSNSSNARKYGGVGVGLWISKNIVEAHSGKIWAESKNRGSTFHILLPKSVKQ